MVDLAEDLAKAREDLAKAHEETKQIYLRENEKLKAEDDKLRQEDVKKEDQEGKPATAETNGQASTGQLANQENSTTERSEQQVRIREDDETANRSIPKR